MSFGLFMGFGSGLIGLKENDGGWEEEDEEEEKYRDQI